VGCSDYALSMFATAQGAKNKYDRLVGKYPNLWKRLGTELATGNLTLDDGAHTEPAGASGHFDLHEADGCDLSQSFMIVETLHRPNDEDA
jgi:hypothetical protein